MSQVLVLGENPLPEVRVNVLANHLSAAERRVRCICVLNIDTSPSLPDPLAKIVPDRDVAGVAGFPDSQAITLGKLGFHNAGQRAWHWIGALSTSSAVATEVSAHAEPHTAHAYAFWAVAVSDAWRRAPQIVATNVPVRDSAEPARCARKPAGVLVLRRVMAISPDVTHVKPVIVRTVIIMNAPDPLPLHSTLAQQWGTIRSGIARRLSVVISSTCHRHDNTDSGDDGNAFHKCCLACGSHD